MMRVRVVAVGGSAAVGNWTNPPETIEVVHPNGDSQVLPIDELATLVVLKSSSKLLQDRIEGLKGA